MMRLFASTNDPFVASTPTPRLDPHKGTPLHFHPSHPTYASKATRVETRYKQPFPKPHAARQAPNKRKSKKAVHARSEGYSEIVIKTRRRGLDRYQKKNSEKPAKTEGKSGVVYWVMGARSVAKTRTTIRITRERSNGWKEVSWSWSEE